MADLTPREVTLYMYGIKARADKLIDSALDTWKTDHARAQELLKKSEPLVRNQEENRQILRKVAKEAL